MGYRPTVRALLAAQHSATATATSPVTNFRNCAVHDRQRWDAEQRNRPVCISAARRLRYPKTMAEGDASSESACRRGAGGTRSSSDTRAGSADMVESTAAGSPPSLANTGRGWIRLDSTTGRSGTRRRDANGADLPARGGSVHARITTNMGGARWKHAENAADGYECALISAVWSLMPCITGSCAVLSPA